RVDRTGTYRVDANVAILQVRGPRARERTQRGFRRAVNAIRGKPFASHDGRVQDDRAAVRYQWKRFLHREQQPFHIGAEDRVEMLLGDRAERRVRGYTRIREHDVELALLALDLRKEPVEIGELCDVTLHAGDIFADVLQSCSQLRVAPAC